MARAEIVLQAASLRADARLRMLARRPGQFIVGPWVSEIGFEVLYWIRCCARCCASTASRRSA